MIHFEVTIQRRHLIIIAGLLAAALVLIPTMSRASHTFDDVGDGNVFHSDIDWLAANGVTKGCNPPLNTKFCPSNAVTRQQMSAFMKRLATGGAVDAGSLGGVDAETLMARIAALEDLLTGVSRNGDILLFDGMNLQVANGTGTTDGTPNGLGNLIVGYNEGTGVTRTGSHYFVAGTFNSYTSYGGAVLGNSNTASGPYSSVTGGQANTASGFSSWASGGQSNTASGQNSSVSGGSDNDATGPLSSVSGGLSNTASGGSSSVSGGQNNTASGSGSSILGGLDRLVVTNHGHWPN